MSFCSLAGTREPKHATSQWLAIWREQFEEKRRAQENEDQDQGKKCRQAENQDHPLGFWLEHLETKEDVADYLEAVLETATLP